MLRKVINLQGHGTPGQIAEEHLSGRKSHFDTAFSCSLCRLCTPIYSKRLPVVEVFLTLRRLRPSWKAAREIVRSRGIKISEMPHNRETTLCCGEGGSAYCPERRF